MTKHYIMIIKNKLCKILCQKCLRSILVVWNCVSKYPGYVKYWFKKCHSVSCCKYKWKKDPENTWHDAILVMLVAILKLSKSG